MGRCELREWLPVARPLVCVLVASLLVACVPRPIYHSEGSVPAPTRAPRPRGSSSQAQPPPSVVRPTQTAHPVDPLNISTANAYQIGVASYYGEPFHGRKTANGEIFNMYKLTAAHRVLPLGTIAKVTNLSNGRWVVVKVNDRVLLSKGGSWISPSLLPSNWRWCRRGPAK